MPSKHANSQKHSSPEFSSPIISPNSELGYFLHVPPFDQQDDQARLAIASIDEFGQDTPKVYEIRSLRKENANTSPLLSPSVNTSASTFEEVKLAERQVFQQGSPEKFDTVEGIYNPESKKHYHFDKLKEMMDYYENCNNNSDSSIENTDNVEQQDERRNFEKYYSAHSFLDVPVVSNPPRHSSKSHYYSAAQSFGYPQPNLQRYDSSKIVRYTLVDKELSHSKSTSSSYHQRLNEYDDDTRQTTFSQPPPPSYNPTLKPKLLTASYYDYWSSSDSSQYTGSRGSKCSSQGRTTDSHYSTMFNQRNQQILNELGYSPSKFFILSNKSNSVNPISEKEVDFYLRSRKQESIEIDSSKPCDPTARPYFTYLTTLIMLAYFVGCLVKNSQLTGAVIQLSPFNVMIGPSAETLIYTGARFTPCIRASSLYPVNEHIYTCPNTPDPDAVTKPNFNDPSSLGIFAGNKTTASGACDLQSVCGGTRFRDNSKPDQGYRFISAIFMHSGIVQLVINSLVHIRLGIQVEKRIHFPRYSVIWLLSGVFGYIFGSLFVPDGNVSVGCSVPLMGIMAFLFVDLIRNWQTITQPVKIMLCIIACFAITLAIGLLPGYDNFSHFGGFIGGILITLATLPMTPSHIQRRKSSDQSILIWLMRIFMLAFIAVLLWIFVYFFIQNGSKEPCYLCQFISCLPFSDMCSPYT